ncbi:MAG: hypothetical protein GY816_05770 [Cytophagales bacterium]|nr:hypothetical protein [Cytophagales bacterium]
MKKLISILSIATLIAVLAVSCSQDSTFDGIIENSDLDQRSDTDLEEDMKDKPGGQ